MDTPKKSGTQQDVGYVLYDIQRDIETSLQPPKTDQIRSQNNEALQSSVVGSGQPLQPSRENSGVVIEQLPSTPAGHYPTVSRVLADPQVQSLLFSIIPTADPAVAARIKLLLDLQKIPSVTVPDTPATVSNQTPRSSIPQTPTSSQSAVPSCSTPLLPSFTQETGNSTPILSKATSLSLTGRSLSSSSMCTPTRSSTGTIFATETKLAQRSKSDSNITLNPNINTALVNPFLFFSKCQSTENGSQRLGTRFQSQAAESTDSSSSSPPIQTLLRAAQFRSLCSPLSGSTVPSSSETTISQRSSRSRLQPDTQSIPLSLTSNQTSSFSEETAKGRSEDVGMSTVSSESTNMDGDVYNSDDIESRTRDLEAEAHNSEMFKEKKRKKGSRKKMYH